MHENGFAEIDDTCLELYIAQTGTIAIWSKYVYIIVKFDFNMTAHWGGIVIMGNKEECQIARINASIIKGGEKIL